MKILKISEEEVARDGYVGKLNPEVITWVIFAVAVVVGCGNCL